jgi:LuxR family maltose regulon positive regulatory protein
LILDDYHTIRNQSIHTALSFFIDHIPDNFHLIVSTRIDPPLPLARLRARNRLTEIRSTDLRFTLDETNSFLAQTMGLILSEEDVKAIETRTEGWIASLQLAAISMRQQNDISSFIRAFTGSNVFVAEYLMEEVLNHIADGDSNQMIADKLVITLSAVKKHTRNIFAKLNVNSRTQAIVRARQLKLIKSN